MLIIGEVSFSDVTTVLKLDKEIRLLKEVEAVYGKDHVVFVGDFFK